MGAAAYGALAAVIGAALAAAAAIYGARVQRQSGVVMGYEAFNTKLVADRDRAESKQAAAEARLAALEAQLAASQADNIRLRAEVTRLGGIP